jgi:hypothetical protein
MKNNNVRLISVLIILSFGLADTAQARSKSFGGGYRPARVAPAPKPAPPAATKAAEPAPAKPEPASTTNKAGWSNSQSYGANAAMNTAARPMMNSSGGFMRNAMWFMLGSSLASGLHASPHSPAQETVKSEDGSTTTSTNSWDANAAVAEPVVDVVLEDEESFAMKILRVMLWAGILFGGYKLLQKIRRRA